MDSAELVWVYQYIYWDEASRAHRTSTQYATREAILNGLGVIVHTNGKKVAYRDLQNEFYVPRTEDAAASQGR